MIPRAVVLGARGMLGEALVRLLPAYGVAVAAALSRAECDITDRALVESVLRAHRPEIVFNAAAFTDVDGAEADPPSAWRANALGPETLAAAAEGCGAKLVHYSTDFAFDGEQERPYLEIDPPSPQGEYARSKVGGERLALARRGVFVLRVGCLYGPGGRNFPSTIARRLLAGETVRADAGRFGSPTCVDDVVPASAALAATDWFGLYHCTSQGETTWAGFARFIAAELGLDPDAQVAGVPTKDLPLRAPRPRRAILDNLMLRLHGLDTLPDWRDAARRFVGTMRAGRTGGVAPAPALP